MTTSAASSLCVVCRTAPTLTSGSYREVLCAECAMRREASPPPPQSPAPARERLAVVRECPCGATTTAGWCDACAADRRALAERAEREREARDAEATLERGRRAALVRVPHGWTDDREAYETAVSSPRLRAIAERWSLERGSLLVVGPTGTGKSASVARALRRLARAATSGDAPSLDVRWMSAATLALARRRHALGAGEAEEIATAIAAPVLVVDELGPEPLDSALHDVVDARYTAERITVTTSGMRLAELAAKYGDATVRRFTAPHGATIEVWR
ncbi:MAG: ATP-binding protein [Myxococcales bacterium]|nr:ATP-binding protein [Myxococcales bacterium]